MSNDLTTSAVARQNILNNPYAVAEIEKGAGIRTLEFEGVRYLLKSQAARFFEVTERTIDDQLADHSAELSQSGYEVVTGKRLKELKKVIQGSELDEVNFVEFKHSPSLGIFSLRAFLNLGMLLPSSERARQLRSMMLDVTIDTINARSGGDTKYINQRDADYLKYVFAGENYRQEFTDALKDHVDANQWKYPNFTDKVYQVIFREKAKEYRKALNLNPRDVTRRTFYGEVLTLIASFEHAIAVELAAEAVRLKRKLSTIEASAVVDRVAENPLSKPHIEQARYIMASRDFGFRGVVHGKLEDYIASIPPADFEKFLGEQSRELERQLRDAQEVLKRLKDR